MKGPDSSIKFHGQVLMSDLRGIDPADMEVIVKGADRFASSYEVMEGLEFLFRAIKDKFKKGGRQ